MFARALHKHGPSTEWLGLLGHSLVKTFRQDSFFGFKTERDVWLFTCPCYTT